MDSENLNLNIPQPDPNWEYYELWQLAHKLKAGIEGTIKYMAVIESADGSTDANLRKQFESLSILCNDCADVAINAFSSSEINELLEE